MSDAADFAKLQSLTPEEAVAFLVGRARLTKSYAWQDVWQDEHGHQFTVSRLNRLDLLQALYDGILKSVEGDLTRTDWMRNAEQLLADAGWWGTKAVADPVTGEVVLTKFDPARLQLIYDTNVRQAYAAGMWDNVERSKGVLPYVRYITKRDSRVRPAHAAWDNLTLPVDHPLWQTHWPPNGWRCRCRVNNMTQRDYDKGKTPTGAALNKTAPDVVLREYVNPRTGEISQVPVGIDPGFAYNPGIARQQALQGVVDGKLAGSDPGLAAAARRAGFKKE